MLCRAGEADPFQRDQIAADAAARYRAGETWGEIAAGYGVTGDYVRRTTVARQDITHRRWESSGSPTSTRYSGDAKTDRPSTRSPRLRTARARRSAPRSQTYETSRLALRRRRPFILLSFEPFFKSLCLAPAVREISNIFVIVEV